MNVHNAFPIMAVSGSAEMYVNPLKIVVVLVLLVLWALAIIWVDRDTDVVKTKRQQWNMITLSGGAVGFFVLLVPPWSGVLMFVGLIAWCLLAGGSLMVYVLHRNNRVVPATRVLTPAHIKSLFVREGKKKAVSTKGQRVQITDSEGKFVEPPSDPEEARDFEALQDFLFSAFWRRASDVDMVSGKERYRLVYRIDGVAAEQSEGLSPEEGERVVRYLKRLAGLTVEEVRRPQHGKIKTALLSQPGEPGTTEVYTSGTTAGERLRLHIRSGPTLIPLENLGIAPQRLEALGKALSHRHHGVFLFAAPPRNGMTTTQYAVVRSHDAYIQNIHSLERRPLRELDNITQRLFEPQNGEADFSRVLQSVFRRDPDIVLVSECEDGETAQLATRVALEDRKIYMGLVAKDSFDALQKYMGYVGDPQAAARALIGVISQRLVRILCRDCREAYRPDAATLKKLNLPADKIECFYRPPSEPVFDKKGQPVICQSCQGTGYIGRTGIFELLLVNEAVAKLLAEGSEANKVKVQARKNRLYYLQEEGLLKVIDGTTSMNEILRALKSSGD